MTRWSIASTTIVAFLLMIVPWRAARAQEPPPPPPSSGAPTPQGEDEVMEQARAHFLAGQNAYNAGDYETAIREFKAADTIKPSPKLDYNIAMAYEQLQKPRAAVKYYKLYLKNAPATVTPGSPSRESVQAKIAQLEAAMPPPGQPPVAGGQPPPPPGPDGQAAQPQPPPQQYAQNQPPPAQPPPAEPPPKKSSYWWIVFPIVGGVLLMVALIALVVAADSAASSSTYYGITVPNGTPSHAPAPIEGPALFRF